MEKSVEFEIADYIKEVLEMKEVEPEGYSPLTLAYIGDSIYDLIIKTKVISEGNKQVKKLHQETSGMVQASAQSEMMRALQPLLTEEEHAVYRRGRNAKSVSPAKNQSLTDYRRATGFEALMGCQDGPIRSIVREAKKHDPILNFVTKERLNQISETGRHQGVIAQAAAYEYAQVEDMLELAKQKGEDPFLILLDNIEDPHNLGAIIRTANLAGAHGVIIPKHRAAGLTATVAKTSAGALNYTPVAKVTNLVKTMEELKEKGLWFVCADMDGDVMYRVNLKGPIGLVIGNEGEGVGRLVKETCDMTAAIPMKGDIDSLNASVAAGVLAYEIVRQRMS